jgi:hypothetical protein
LPRYQPRLRSYKIPACLLGTAPNRAIQKYKESPSREEHHPERIEYLRPGRRATTFSDHPQAGNLPAFF